MHINQMITKLLTLLTQVKKPFCEGSLPALSKNTEMQTDRIKKRSKKACEVFKLF